MSTPIYKELEEKWNAVGEDLLELIEDDEGNEVFPETQYSPGGYIGQFPGGYIGQFPELHKAIFEDRTYCPVSNVAVDRPKRKFKLFGRNQGTNGTL